MKRILAIIGVAVLVCGSLLTFPSRLPWMAAIWITLAILALVRNKPIWPWLASCAIILLVKRPGYTASFWIFIALVTGVAWYHWRTSFKENAKSTPPDLADERSFPTRSRTIIYAAILLFAVAFWGASRWYAANTSETRIADSRPIACLGDSLTAAGYPHELQKLIVAPVADFGVNGITTDDGIRMIPEILAIDPQLVIIELGGHDYNTGHKSRAATKTNLLKLVDTFKENDIDVILVEIPRGFISDPYNGLEREIAAERDLQLIDDTVIRSFIFNSPILPPGIWLKPSQRYSNDGLHPNELGNKRFATAASRALVKLYGDTISQ